MSSVLELTDVSCTSARMDEFQPRNHQEKPTWENLKRTAQLTL